MPTSESDILKSLAQRVADLEARVKQLESGPTLGVKADPCPRCGGRLKLTDEHSHPTFGALGIKERVFTCESCSRTVTRDFDPSKG